MGHGSFSATAYMADRSDRVLRGSSTFAYSDSQAHSKIKRIHPDLLVLDKIRESRDSADHPNSVAIACAFDVTGSMDHAPRIFQENLHKLYGALTERLGVGDPQIMSLAFDDARNGCVNAAFQATQFESDNRIDIQIRNVILTREGGGGTCESSELAAYFLAHRTAIDCYEKRQVKGLAFIVTDECCYPDIYREHITKYISSTVPPQVSLRTEDVFKELLQRWDCFVIIPQDTYMSRRAEEGGFLGSFWEDYVGASNIIYVKNSSHIVEAMAAIAGYKYGDLNKDEIISRVADDDSAILSALQHSLRVLPDQSALRNSAHLPNTHATPTIMIDT